ncbi:hypothetical protein EST38_g10378 [Candolleomyces aberdarensis]|uniref:Nucleoplasmin-like domain-containing protein n=1 Tax=Candolleomyces aberdarensis TaxID=2316362 RepID=A0A4Q2D7J3_9AGAR|nr:hypothetical protein EST38_g10378 [Candolleomyces aberdarensis]
MTHIVEKPVSFWSTNVPSNGGVTVTPDDGEPIIITNASFQLNLENLFTLPLSDAHCTLEFTYPIGGKEYTVPIALFSRHVFEQARLDLRLEPGNGYHFDVSSPFGVDILGHVLQVEIPATKVKKGGPVTCKTSVPNATAAQPDKRKNAATADPKPKQKVKAKVHPEPKKSKAKNSRGKGAAKEDDPGGEETSSDEEGEGQEAPAAPAAAKVTRKRTKVTNSKNDD